MINVGKLVSEYKTEYKEGFTEEELTDLVDNVMENNPFNIEKFDDAMMCNTCLVIDGKSIIYHCDIITGLKCGLENRGITFKEWD